MQPPQTTLYLANIIRTILKFPPIFDYARGKAREKIVKKGEAIGVKWNKERSKLSQATNWATRVSDLEDKDLVYPDYYRQSFHSYDQGNLCMEAALEVELASDCVHADVMDPEKKHFEKEGDWNLRRSYHNALNAILDELNLRQNFDGKFQTLDVGCSTGRSSRAILEAFPNASITGIELSPYFLAVGKHLYDQRVASGKTEDIKFVHGAMEDNKFEDLSFDLVSICLVFHELPQSVIQGVLKSAWRVLRPNGVISIMDMDPESPTFVKIRNNPFAFAAFTCTEPWVLEYTSTNLIEELENIGFKSIKSRSNSPGHKTVVGVKNFD